MFALRRLLVVLCLAVILPVSAWPQSAKVTFVLTNDIYLMGETIAPDGKPRGGFARLAAVVKAERAVAVPHVGHRRRRAYHRTDQHVPA